MRGAPFCCSFIKCMQRGGILKKHINMARSRSSKVVFKGDTAYFDDANEAKLIRNLIENVEAANLPDASANDVLVSDGSKFNPVSLDTVFSNATLSTQGYYGLLTNFYFASAQASETVIGEDEVGTFVDVNFTIANDGKFDYRPSSMKEAFAAGHTGTGTAGDPIVFSLEGLDTHASANFRASMSFVPEIDEGQLETRLIFTRHIGATPTDQFPIEEVTLAMEQGADIHYPAEPMLSFFVGDTIDTNGPGDSGTCKFQVKSSVEGTLHMRALTWFISV